MDDLERNELVKAVRDGLAADINSGRLAQDIADDMAKEPPGITGLLKNAGEAIGLIAGVVALAYVLGGVVIVCRLLFDHSRAEQAVAVLGALPRENVITLGFVEVLGSAALVGLVAAVIAVAADKPSAEPDDTSLWQPGHLIPSLTAGALVATVISAFLVAKQVPWHPWMLAVFGAAFVLTVACLLAGWRAMRLAGGQLAHRASRAILVGTVFTVIAVPLTLASATLLRFQPVQLCVSGYASRQPGRLIALTKDQAVVVQSPPHKGRRIVSLPGDAITRTDSGDLAPPLPACPKPADSSKATGGG